MKKAIIFDCWGTLFYDDINPRPLDEFAAKLGRTMKDYSYLRAFEENLMLEKCEDLERAIRNLMGDLDIEIDEKLVKELTGILENMRKSDKIKSYPKTLETLRMLKDRGFRLGIISNAINHDFESLDMKYDIRNLFDVIVLSYEEGVIKPDPKIFKIALERLGTSNSETLMVGDNLKDDVIAAEEQGIDGLLLDNDNKYPEFNRRIMSISQIFDYLK
ncbi:MAG: HAD-IA family hydrolase [Candidatus Aenigmarchaeota archaeon]|nr:HAD-IA family hydrolase [Candidatus Aenigmarchaeota archaeon]